MFPNYSKDTAPEKKDTVPEKQKVESYLNDKSYPKTDRYPKTYEARKAEVYKDVFGSKKPRASMRLKRNNTTMVLEITIK
ncbi:hypothetical protein L5515_018689 [Caenorhabditis briggsae]|uniref:Uncharacterized protein n=1 Tax=Caenorhabditis briggsae TaxID=6238 RepID=A0AAE9JSL4_CAEBR|nr:hypothetical protein L5515_018689 [Caenorhabditis briggsae]